MEIPYNDLHVEQDPINYNDPLELREVFRLNMTNVTEGDVGPKQEFSGLCTVCWEDIRGIDQYFYPDDWYYFKGEKYYLILANKAAPKLILGSYKEITQYWKRLRNEFPIFMPQPNNDEEED